MIAGGEMWCEVERRKLLLEDKEMRPCDQREAFCSDTRVCLIKRAQRVSPEEPHGRNEERSKWTWNKWECAGLEAGREEKYEKNLEEGEITMAGGQEFWEGKQLRNPQLWVWLGEILRTGMYNCLTVILTCLLLCFITTHHCLSIFSADGSGLCFGVNQERGETVYLSHHGTERRGQIWEGARMLSKCSRSRTSYELQIKNILALSPRQSLWRVLDLLAEWSGVVSQQLLELWKDRVIQWSIESHMEFVLTISSSYTGFVESVSGL